MGWLLRTQEHFNGKNVLNEENSVGGTVKRLVVCSLCRSATIWSDALFHASLSVIHL